MNVCIIPARGGSKRIPRKNIRFFCGKPMIAWSIGAAKSSGIFDRIIVSTDCPDIAEIACQQGAEVPFLRPANLADDRTTTDAVIVHALDWLEANGYRPQFACCLYATAPFVQPYFLKQGLVELMFSEATTAISVTSFPFPIFRGLTITQKGTLEMLWPEHRLTRSQDLPDTFHDAGQFYWLNVSRFSTCPTLYAKDSIPIRLPRYLVQDIDTEEDWKRAEVIFKGINS